jgi:hypothetical protein
MNFPVAKIIIIALNAHNSLKKLKNITINKTKTVI